MAHARGIILEGLAMVRFRFLTLGSAILLAGLSSSSAVEKRLVTVGGAVTETAFALGWGDKIVAVDSTSVFPESVTKLPSGWIRKNSVGGGPLVSASNSPNCDQRCRAN